MLRKIAAFLVCLLFLAPSAALAGQVKTLKVTVLSTMLADQGLGEWGYSALVEVDGRKFLFDAGANSDLVLKNANAMLEDEHRHLARLRAAKTAAEVRAASSGGAYTDKPKKK